MSVIDKILDQLKAQVINLLDDILSICPDESDILLMRIFFENQLSPDIIMTEFIKWVYPWKDYINKHDEKFFIENDHIFGNYPSDQVQHFKQKFIDGTFTEEDKSTIWAYFEVFISLIDQFNTKTNVKSCNEKKGRT